MPAGVGYQLGYLTIMKTRCKIQKFRPGWPD